MRQEVRAQWQEEWTRVLRLAQAQLREDFRRQSDAVIAAAAAKSKSETEQWLADFAKLCAENRAADQQVIFAALQQMEAKRAADLRSLRKELETVAVLTQDSLQDTQSQLVRLANFKQP